MNNLQKWLVFGAGVVLVMVIGYIDYLTGDYSMLVFYFIPVCLVSWFSGRWRGAIIAVLSSLARFSADLAAYTVTDLRLHQLEWNSATEMIFLVIVAVLIALLRKTLVTGDRTPR
jgi:K+-sensing histidine kinase KdpD